MIREETTPVSQLEFSKNNAELLLRGQGHGCPWVSMGVHGCPWAPMSASRLSWHILDFWGVKSQNLPKISG